MRKYAFRAGLIGFMACAGCAATADAPTGEGTKRELQTPDKLPVCTVDSDPDTCVEPPPKPIPPVEYNYVTVTSDTSADVYFSTEGAPQVVTVVVSPSGWSAPDTLAAAQSSPGSKSKVVNEPAIHDHKASMTTLAPCATHWYGLYVGGSLVRSGTFITNPPGGFPLTAVKPVAHDHSVDVGLVVPSTARSGYLDIQLLAPSGAPIVTRGDRTSLGPITRTVGGLRPSTRYGLEVYGCGANYSSSVATTIGNDSFTWRGDRGEGDTTAAAIIRIDDAGHWDFHGWADEGGLLGHYYTMAARLDDPITGKPYFFVHTGTVHGKAVIGSSHDSWSSVGINPSIAADYATLTTLHPTYAFQRSLDPLDLVQAIAFGTGALGLTVDFVEMIADGRCKMYDGSGHVTYDTGDDSVGGGGSLDIVCN